MTELTPMMMPSMVRKPRKRFARIDCSATAIEYARDRCQVAACPVHLFQHDIVQQDLDSNYDVVMCSQFLHHFEACQAQSVLDKMIRAARQQIWVVDLLRSRLNWLQVWIATRTLSRSKIVHFDGPQSIRASFRIGEIETLARRVGLAKFSVRKHWPCRFVLIGYVNEHR